MYITFLVAVLLWAVLHPIAILKWALTRYSKHIHFAFNRKQAPTITSEHVYRVNLVRAHYQGWGSQCTIKIWQIWWKTKYVHPSIWKRHSKSTRPASYKISLVHGKEILRLPSTVVPCIWDNLRGFEIYLIISPRIFPIWNAIASPLGRVSRS